MEATQSRPVAGTLTGHIYLAATYGTVRERQRGPRLGETQDPRRRRHGGAALNPNHGRGNPQDPRRRRHGGAALTRNSRAGEPENRVIRLSPWALDTAFANPTPTWNPSFSRGTIVPAKPCKNL